MQPFRLRILALFLILPLFSTNYNVKTTSWNISDNQSFAYAIQNATSLSDHIRFDLPGGLGGTITVDGNNTLNAGHLINLHTTIVTLAGASASLNTSSNMTLSGPFDIQCRLYVPNSSNLYLDGTGTNTLSSLEMWNSTLFIQGNTVINDYLSINRTAGSNCYFNVSATKTITVAGGFLSLMAPMIKLGDGLFHLANADTLVYNSEGIVVGSNLTTGGVMLLGSTVDFPPSFSLATPSGATLSQISFSNTSTLASYGTITLSGDGGLLDLATNVVMNIQTLASTSATAYLAKTGGGTLRVTNLYDLPQPPKLYGGVLQFNTLNAMNGTAVNLYGGTLSLAEENTYPNELLFNGAASVFIPGSNVVTWSGTITSAATGGTSVFHKTGSGTLYLSGSSNNFGSPISVNEGVLRVATQGNISGTLGPPLITFNGGTLDFASLITIGNNFNVPAGKIATLSGANADLNGTFSGSGDLRLLSDNFTILPASASPFTGSVLKTFGFLNVNNNAFPNASIFYLYNGSVLQGYTDVSLSGNVSLSGGVTFWVNDNGSGTLYKMTLSGSVYSGGTLSKQGTGILYLTGVNSYSMGTNILDGILEGNADSIKGDITLAASSEVIFNQASTGTFAGNITGSGVFTKTGGAILTLLGTNNQNGNLFVREGILAGSPDAFGGSGPVNITQTLATIRINHTATTTATLSRNFTGPGSLIKTGTGQLVLTGNVNNDQVSVSQGTLQTYPLEKTLSTINVATGATYIVDSSNSGVFNGNSVVNGNLVIKGGADLEYRATLSNGTGTTSLESGRFYIYQNGNVIPSGTFTFNGANTQLALFKSGVTTLSNHFNFNQTNCGFYANNTVNFDSSSSFTSGTGTSSSILYSGAVLDPSVHIFNIGQSSTYEGGLRILSCCFNLTDASFPNSYYTNLNNASLAILDSSGSGRQMGGLESTTFSYIFCGTTLGGNNGTLIGKQNRNGSFSGQINCNTYVKTGSAKLTLAGASNISNKVILSEGELEISSLADVGPINNFELNAGKLKVTTYSSFPSNITVTNSPILEHSGLTLSGNIVGTGDLTINSGVYTNIAPPSNNTISGQITLTGGGQFLVVPSSFPNASGIIMSSSPILSNGGNINFSMPVTIGPGTTTLGVYGSSIFTFSAQVSGSTTIVKTGSGTIDFNTIQKSFSGDIVVSQGAVVIGGNSPLNSVSSVTNNGTFQVASTATSARLNNFESTGNFIIDSNIQLNNSLNKTISGSISGASALIKTGAGTTTISAANSSFSGGLFIDQGTVVVQGSFLTGNCATVATRTGSSLDLSNAPTPTLNSATGGGAFLLGSNGVTLTASSVSVYEITGPISGTGGSLTINGVGDYRFTGSNSYSGGTTVNGGILSGDTTGIQGNIINNSLVRFLDGGTYSGNMSGNGTLSVSLGGVLTLSGTNSFTGGIDISGGTVAGNSGSIKGNITNSGALIFNQSSNGTYSGTILGNGPLTKNLSGNLNLTGASGTYTGNISVSGGSLGVNANYSSANISIAGGTTAYGAGSVKNMSNSGTLNPGNSIGTINITGDYTQSSSATLNIEIDPSGACDLVAVTGIANLNGTLNIIQTPGFYVGGTTYTFLTAGVINSDFTTRNSGTVVNPVFVLTSTNYSLIVDSGGGGGGQFVPPLPNSAISGNSFEVASALFCDDVTSTGDLQQIKLGLVGLSPQDYLIALSSIAPDEMSGVTLIEMENQSKIMNLLSNRTDRLSEAYYKTYSPMPKNTFFVSPISFWLNQRGNNYAIGYRGNTTGLGLGYENQWIKNTFYGFATAYTHSFYRFYSQQGRISSNGFYFSPYVSTKIENLYLTSGLLGSYDAMKFFRYIVYPGVNRTAYCQPSTWNLSGQVQCHYSLDLSSNKYLEPLFQMTFSGIYRNGTTENGADSLDFSYPSQWNATARALLKCTAGIVRCFDNDLSLDSRAALGYVLNGLITSNNYEANFLVPSQVCYSNLDFQGLNVNQSQLFSEIQFIAKLKDRGKASLDLSYQWGRTMNVASVNFSLEAQF